MKILFLDDNLERHKVFKGNSIGHTVDHVYNAQEAIAKLNSDVQYDLVYLDHDLNFLTENEINEGEEDGRFICRHLLSLSDKDKFKATTFVIHSLNGPAGSQMHEMLWEEFFTHKIPFAWKYSPDDIPLCQ